MSALVQSMATGSVTGSALMIPSTLPPPAPSGRRVSTLIIGTAPFVDDVFGKDGIYKISQISDLLAPPMSAQELLKSKDKLSTVDVLLTTWMPARLDQDLLTAAPKLKAVFHAAGSIRGMVTPATWARPIAISSA